MSDIKILEQDHYRESGIKFLITSDDLIALERIDSFSSTIEELICLIEQDLITLKLFNLIQKELAYILSFHAVELILSVKIEIFFESQMCFITPTYKEDHDLHSKKFTQQTWIFKNQVKKEEPKECRYPGIMDLSKADKKYPLKEKYKKVISINTKKEFTFYNERFDYFSEINDIITILLLDEWISHQTWNELQHQILKAFSEGIHVHHIQFEIMVTNQDEFKIVYSYNDETRDNEEMKVLYWKEDNLEEKTLIHDEDNFICYFENPYMTKK